MNVRQLVQTALVLTVVALAAPASAFAKSHAANHNAGSHHPAHRSSRHCGAPEIDPSSMVAALALLSGGLFMVADRFRTPRV